MPTRKWGTEFAVNTSTFGAQDQPTVVTLADGGFMIAWRDDGPADSVIRAQRYDALGAKVGGELSINPTAGDQSDPVLVSMSNGNILALQQDFNTVSDRNIVAFEITPGGAQVRNLSPATSGLNDDVSPAGASLGSNGVVTVWQERTIQGGDILMRAFNADGTDSFGAVVNTNAGTITSEQFGAAVAASPGGARFAVTWHDAGLGGGVRARVFNANGTQFSAEFAVSSLTPDIGDDATTSVAWLNAVNFVVSWTSANGDGSSTSIKYAICNVSGSVSVGERLANSTLAATQEAPVVAALPNGGFVIAWQDSSQTGVDRSGSAIRLQAFDGAGDKTGGEILVNTAIAFDQRDVALTALADGRVIVTWAGTDGSNDGIRAQIVDPRDGMIDGSPFGDILYGHDVVGDEMSGFGGDDDIFGLGGNDRIAGGDGNDKIFGGTGDDQLFGEDGPDTLVGGAGADLLDGGGGGVFDTVDYSGSAVGVVAALDGSFPNAGDAAGDVFVAVENLRGSNSDDILRGDAGFNILTGEDGNDVLDGAGGFDSLRGGLGDDTFVLGSEGDSVNDQGGNDTVIAPTSQNLSTFKGDIENVTLVGSDNVNATGDGVANRLIGNDGKNTLTGAAGSDLLEGGGGADQMIGGLDDDFYIVDDLGDTVIEANETGIDSVDSLVTFSLGSQFIERLTLIGFDDIDGFGNGLANVLTGNDGDNALDGGGGADRLDGGLGLDILSGGTGDDFYIVDNLGDVVNELAGEGTADRVAARASYVLGDAADIELLTTDSSTGIRKVNLTGNALDQSIVGNAGMNILKGGGGKDALQGLGGNDTYYVDSADDTVIETTKQDTADLVATTVSYTLGAAAQIETLRTTSNAGTSAIDLTGNGFDQTIIGNSADNVLKGAGGKDVLQGLGGSDTYYVDSATDVVVEGAGNGTADLVAASASHALDAAAEIETLRTTSNGGTSAINLTGSATAQAMFGNAGANILDGKGGSDTLSGLGGKDFFAFSSALGAGNVDTITDFNLADDTIQLDDAVFVAFAGLSGAILAGNFRANLTGLAEDADDRIIYELDTGKLFYDVDGNAAGAGIQFATIAAQMALTNADFVAV